MIIRGQIALGLLVYMVYMVNQENRNLNLRKKMLGARSIYKRLQHSGSKDRQEQRSTFR